MFHPNSDYGKLQKLLDGNTCICDLESKQSGRLLGKNCYAKLLVDNSNLIKRFYHNNVDVRMSRYEEALEILGYSIRDIK